MISLILGFLAGLCWSCHDLLARKTVNLLGPYRMGWRVMLAGAAMLALPVVWRGDVASAPREAVVMALAMGVIYAIAAAGLFYALTFAPVSIVGPIIGGYPALVVVWGLLNGLQPRPLQWACMAIILLGAVIVARSEHEGDGSTDVAWGKLPIVLAASVVSATGYAATAVMGQKAAEHLGALDVTFLSRFPAAVVFLVFMLVQRRPVNERATSNWGATFAMAAFDVSAVTAINASAYFPNRELGAMAISGSSATSVLLAVLILKERVTLLQWLGVALVVAGVAGLAAP